MEAESPIFHNNQGQRIFRGYFLTAVFFTAVFFTSLFCAIPAVQAATLLVSPSTGTFTVGSTFSVSIFLNTENEVINTIAATLSFPPDRLQLVSPSAGNSIISIWTTLPSVDNQTGRINLQGGIPGGIKVSNGLITTLTFRVKSVGAAVVKFSDSSRTLLNDGRGTDSLKQTTNGVFSLELPPPAGPIVSSETHPDQAQWYANATAVLRWAAESNVDGYSYILNDQPVDFSDDISEGAKTALNYKNLNDGISYFHIKALKGSGWGGTTHFAIKVDTTPPADFPIEIIPAARTIRRQPIIQFSSTDAASGLDHYEMKIVPLRVTPSAGAAINNVLQPLFIDAVSPYVTPELDLGSYDVIIRAYDNAGNYREHTQKLNIVTALFSLVRHEGLGIKSTFIVPWLWVWVVFGLVALLLIYASWRFRRWHNQIAERRSSRELPSNVQLQLKELQQYRSRYGKIAIIFLILLSFVPGAFARSEPIEVPPPFISTVSRNVTNEEIFYAGGKTEAANTTIILFLQNLTTGETISESVISNRSGEWFYRHGRFLTSGNYLLWAQGKIGDQLSPPSPQVKLSVHPTAIQFGASRLSLEAVYLLLFLLALLAIAILAGYAAYHAYHGRKKHQAFLKEIHEAEQSVRRGFAVLRRDIEAELSIVKRAKLSKELSQEEKIKENQLLKDLNWVEKYIGKEIWDVEKVENAG